MNYVENAQKFAQSVGLKMEVCWLEYAPISFWYDNIDHHIFRIALKRKGKQYTFSFGQSVFNGSQEPTLYDVLACLTKYDVGTFEDFCWGFGYDTDSIKVLKTYKAVCKEYKSVERLFSDVMEQLQEIE